jgi:hypothetical protein
MSVSNSFFQVIGRMRDDEIARLVKSDTLILKYSQHLFSRRGIEEHSSSQISGRLWELGKLTRILRVNTNIKVSNLSQALDPGYFDDVLVAVHELGEFSSETNMCRKGSLVQKLDYQKPCL